MGYAAGMTTTKPRPPAPLSIEAADLRHGDRIAPPPGAYHTHPRPYYRSAGVTINPVSGDARVLTEEGYTFRYRSCLGRPAFVGVHPEDY